MDNLFKFRMKALALIAILLVSAVSASAQIDTVAIIDAGSSGSRLYVYAVDISKKTVACIYPSDTTPKDNLKGEELAKIPGNKDSVKAFLNDMTAKFPNQGRKPKELYVLATAGMRQKPETKTRPIYDLMKDSVKTCNNYKVKYAMTISGQYEGLYAWIAANYSAGKIGASVSAPEKTPTYTGTPYGIIEIGGASLQITFAVNEKKDGTISRKGFSNIYSKSYLGGGLNQFEKGTNKKNVIDDLGKIKDFCKDTYFYGIGWAFDGLWKTSEETKKAYVTEILKTLGKGIDPIESTWTKGAVFDIVINKHAPEQFDYRDQK